MAAATPPAAHPKTDEDAPAMISLKLVKGSELAEGVRTLHIAHHLARQHKLHVPITDMLYAVVFERYPIEKALQYLMTYPYAVDVDFL